MGETSTSSFLCDQSRKCRSPNTIRMIALVAVLVCFSVLRVFIGAPDLIQESEATLDVSRKRADRVELDTATLPVESNTPVSACDMAVIGTMNCESKPGGFRELDHVEINKTALPSLPPTLYPSLSPITSGTQSLIVDYFNGTDHPMSSPNLPPTGPPTRMPIVQLVTIPKTTRHSLPLTVSPSLSPTLSPSLPPTSPRTQSLTVDYFNGTDYFNGAEICPLESLPKKAAWLYFQEVTKTNAALAVAARPFSISGPPLASEPQIPRRLIFTHRYNLFDCESRRDHLDPTLHMLAANARQTVALYRQFWGEPAAEVTFLTDTDCIRVLNATEPRLIRFFNKEQGMYKADMCRVAELYLRGGYYFDVDLLAVHPVSPADSVGFVTVKGSNWPKKGFFQAFTASAPGHPILKKSLDTLLEVYQGKRKRKGWIGPKTMQIAYELYLNETLPVSRDVLLLDEVAIKHVKKLGAPRYLRRLPQQPEPGKGFRSGVCNYVVYDKSTQYFFSRVNGTAWCGAKLGGFREIELVNITHQAAIPSY
jgi:hypothetical protein